MKLNIQGNKRKNILIAISLVVICALVAVSSFLYFNKTTDATVSGWMAGRIIDDSVFTNKSSMTASQIQTFLNTQMPTCDTYGQQLSEFGGPDLNSDGKVQRWEWGKYYYNQTVFTCLRNYKENNISAAQIIYNVAQKYSINPRVLLVLLQKEQSLVTDDWPLTNQYLHATGFGCPDTAECDTQYYGFTNQVTMSATMFRAIMDNSPSWSTPYNIGNNYVRYNPDTACGGSTVYIQNRATQALYNYTPYQPNAATLNANWGATVTCGAYGNLNFYRYYTKWFGATTSAAIYDYSLISRDFYSDYTYQTKVEGTPEITPGQTIYARVIVKNTGNQAWYRDNLKLGTADPRDRASEFATLLGNGNWLSTRRAALMNEDYVDMGENATFEFALIAPPHLGFYAEAFSVVIEGYRWLDDVFRLGLTVYSPTTYYYARPLTFEAYSDLAMTKEIDLENVTLYTDSKIYVKTTIKNTGNQTLPSDITKIATSNPRDRSSVYSDESWLSDNRSALPQEGNILPQSIGTFNFILSAPSSSLDITTEQFGLVLENLRWLNDNLGSLSIRTVTRPPSLLSKGQTLLKGQILLSGNESYQLRMQYDGNLVLYDINNKPLWASRTNGRGGVILRMQYDGNLVIYTANNKSVWATGTNLTISN
ncbi:MAG: hypothetical protein WBI29_02695 [Candidatus Saccharimonadales bacterium]